MKKFLSVCLSIFMMASLFAGCGDTGLGKNQGADNEEKVKISIWITPPWIQSGILLKHS